MQAQVDTAYKVVKRCIEENRTPILKNGVLKVGSSKGKEAIDLKAYEHIGNLFKEAITSTNMKVYQTNDERWIKDVWKDLTNGINEASLAAIGDEIKNPKPQSVAAELRPPMSPSEICDHVLAGDPVTADILIFSHRESKLTAKPFTSLLQKLREVDNSNLSSARKKAAYENALAFTSLYLENGGKHSS